MGLEEAKIGYYLDIIHSKHAFQEAKATGREVVLPNNTTLMVDIDSEAQYEIYLERLAILARWYKTEEKEIQSKSGKGHKHIYVTFPKGPHFKHIERVFLQLFLCSDSTREFLSYQRTKHNDPHPILFIENQSTEEDNGL